MRTLPPRFKIGDRVQIVSNTYGRVQIVSTSARYPDKTAVIVKVDESQDTAILDIYYVRLDDDSQELMFWDFQLISAPEVI